MKWKPNFAIHITHVCSSAHCEQQTYLIELFPTEHVIKHQIEWVHVSVFVFISSNVLHIEIQNNSNKLFSVE